MTGGLRPAVRCRAQSRVRDKECAAQEADGEELGPEQFANGQGGHREGRHRRDRVATLSPPRLPRPQRRLSGVTV
jgi:hypothetical protein